MKRSPCLDNRAGLLCGLVGICISTWPGTARGQRVEDLTPTFARAGQVVALGGSGFDPAGGYTLTVGGVPASIAEIQTDHIDFVVPAGATTGFVDLTTSGGATLETFFPLSVTRPIEAGFGSDLLSSAPLAGYGMGTLFGDSAQSAAPFAIEVEVGEPTLVIGGREDAALAFFAIATDSQGPMELSALSSALAMLYLTPQVSTADPAEADRRLAGLAALDETQQAAGRILTLAAAGQDYAADPQLRAVLVQALGRWLDDERTRQSLSFAAGKLQRFDYAGGPLAFAPGYPRNLPVPGFELLDRLDVKGLPAPNSERGIPQAGIKYTPASFVDFGLFKLGGSPLDWLAVDYELDASPYGSRGVLDALEGSHTRTYARKSNGPLGLKVIPATPVGSNLKILSRFTKWLAATIVPPLIPDGSTPPEQTPDLSVPADDPGLFEVRLYSGADFPPQASLVNGNEFARRMLVHNARMAVLETATLPLKIIGTYGGKSAGANSTQKATKTITGILSTVEGAIARELAQGTLNGHTIVVIINSAGRAIAEAAVGEIVGAGVKLGGKSLGVLLASVEIGVDVAQPIARVTSLTNAFNAFNPNFWSGQAVQTSLAVVGDPFVPRIASFEPRLGYRGTVVLITGSNFSSTPNQNLVRFGGAVTDPLDPNAGVVAEVVAARAGALMVRVPEGAADGEVNISVAVVARGFASTASLDPPYRTFRVVPDPVIASISPDPPTANTLMKIQGTNFHPVAARNQIMLDPPDNMTVPLSGTTTTLVVRVPNSVDPHTVRVVIDGRPSNSVAFTPVLPEGDLENGGSIVIADSRDVNEADGFITLREAILLAGGSLGRPLLLRPDGDNDFEDHHFESDWVTGSGGFLSADGVFPGVATADFIDVNLDQRGDQGTDGMLVDLASPLPPLASGDYYVFWAMIVDGAALSNGDGLVFQNADRTYIEGITLRNIPGRGIVLNNATRCTIGGRDNVALEPYEINILNPGGDGVTLEGVSEANILRFIKVLDGGGHGLRLSGDDVQLNTYIPSYTTVDGDNRQAFDDNDGFGILIENGASFNTIQPPNVRRNGMGGIRVSGADTLHNRLGQDIDVLAGPDRPRIFDNLGPGVWIEAPYTHARYMNVAGNQGDGILIEGASTHDVNIDAMRIGYDDDNPTTPIQRANLGSGIHVRGGAHEILIGTEPESNLTFLSRNYLGGNRDDGVWIEGTDTRDVKVQLTYSGRVDHDSGIVYVGLGEPVLLSPLGNGRHGLAITGGAHDVAVGAPAQAWRFEAIEHHAGAGIYLEGVGTRGITIQNAVLGATSYGDPGFGNRYGIRVAGGARAVQIGVPGEAINQFGGPDPSHLTHNVIQGNDEAGILLESGGIIDGSITPDQPPPTPKDAIVVQNNYIGRPFRIDNFTKATPNEVGILLRDGAVSNKIGGRRPFEKNVIERNRRAGIEIDGVVAAFPVPANRIIGNDIFFTGRDEDPSLTPLTAAPHGVGVLLSNGARGHAIGEPGGGANTFTQNHIGVLIDVLPGDPTPHGTRIEGNTFSLNRVAGVFLRDARGVTVGPSNALFGNGREVLGLSAPAPLGGVAMAGGGGHAIVGNVIGSQLTPLASPSQENVPDGVLIHESADNRLGDLGVGGRNTIINNRERGVRIEGALSTGNRAQNNAIGIFGALSTVAPNRAGGILLTAGASGNLIGGQQSVPVAGALMSMDAGNAILNNQGDGVRVDGVFTLHNTITYNSISGHAGFLGIQNINGGNTELPPPTIATANLTTIEGTVDDTRVPDGSFVQLFTDPAGEGLALLGPPAIVVNGAFQLAPALAAFPNVTATVTDLAGDTSEFSSLAVLSHGPSLDLRRDIEPPLDRDSPVNREATLAAIRVTNGEEPARLERMIFFADGSIDEPAALTGVSIWIDRDGDDLLGEADEKVIGPAPVASNDSSVTLALNLPFNAGERAVLLLTAMPNAAAAEGQTLHFRLESHLFVASSSIFPIGEITETGAFPMLSDTVTLGAPVFTAADIVQYLLTGVGYDPNMDTNGDGVVDIADVVNRILGH